MSPSKLLEKWVEAKLPGALLWDALIGLGFGFVMWMVGVIFAVFAGRANTITPQDLRNICAVGIGLVLVFRVFSEHLLRRKSSWFLKTLRAVGFGWLWSTTAPPNADDVSAMERGGIVGAIMAGVLAACLIVWEFATGNSDWKNWEADGTAVWALGFAAMLGAIPGFWFAASWRGLYRRTRFVVSVPLMAFAGMFGLSALNVAATDPIEYSPAAAHFVRAVFGDLGRGKIILYGAPIGLGVLALWLLIRRALRGGRRRGSLVDGFLEAGNRVAAFVLGLLYFGCVALCIAFNHFWWQWFGDVWPVGVFVLDGIDTAAWIREGLIWSVYIAAAVFVFLGVRAWRTAFKGAPRLDDQGVHGRADFASEDEAAMAARGHRVDNSTEGLNLNY